MKYQIDQKEIRVYHKEASCIFKKNNEEFGGLSNMASGFPLKVNGINIKTTEALYQACRFPHLPEIQHKIIEEKSPMVVKMISNTNKKRSREDWENIRLKVMKWCVQLKLAQNFVSFGTILHETGLKNIVENSAKDNYWGAIPNESGTIFTGKNALGRLLMDLRQAFYSNHNFALLYVEPPQIEKFLLLNEQIGVIDERQNFINWLHSYWEISNRNEIFVSTVPADLKKRVEADRVKTEHKFEVKEGKERYTTKKKRKQKKTQEARKEKKGISTQASLFNLDNPLED